MEECWEMLSSKTWHGMAFMRDHASEHCHLDEQGARELLPKAEKLLATDGHWGRGSSFPPGCDL